MSSATPSSSKLTLFSRRQRRRRGTLITLDLNCPTFLIEPFCAVKRFDAALALRAQDYFMSAAPDCLKANMKDVSCELALSSLAKFPPDRLL